MCIVYVYTQYTYTTQSFVCLFFVKYNIQLTAGADIQPLIGEQTSLEIVRRVKGNTEFWAALPLEPHVPGSAPMAHNPSADAIPACDQRGPGGQAGGVWAVEPFDALLVRRDK